MNDSDGTPSREADDASAERVTCPVCMERFAANEVCTLRCSHQICAQCLPQLQVGSCPICRQPIYPPAAPPPVHNFLGVVGEGITIEGSGGVGAADNSTGLGTADHQIGSSRSMDDLLRFSLQEFMDHIRDDAPVLTPRDVTAAEPGSLAPAPTAAAMPTHARSTRTTHAPDAAGDRRDPLSAVVLCRESALGHTLEAVRRWLAHPAGARSPPPR